MSAPITHETKDGKLTINMPVVPQTAITATYENFATGATYSANYMPDDITSLHRIFIGMPELFIDYIRACPKITATKQEATARFAATSGSYLINFDLVMRCVQIEPTAEMFTELRQDVRAQRRVCDSFAARIAAIEMTRPVALEARLAAVESRDASGAIDYSSVSQRCQAFDVALQRLSGTIDRLNVRLEALESASKEAPE